MLRGLWLKSLSLKKALLCDALERAQEERQTYRSLFGKIVKLKLSIAAGRVAGAKLICHDILLPNNNCVPMVTQFRKNLQTILGKLVLAKLEILFPLIFKGHELISQDYQALANAQQL
jgi:hypothetical protein